MSGPGTGSSSPTDRGSQYDRSGEIDILSQLMGPMSGILNALLGMSPDAMALNAFTGNPYAGQMARFGGRTPRQADVMNWESQQTYYNLQNQEAARYRERVASHWFGMTGQENSGIRAQNAASSIYNPVGLATRLGMMAYGEKGSQQAMAQGFMSMNMYAPGPFDNPRVGNFATNQKIMGNFQTQMDADFFADPSGYGGFNLQGRSEVFQQMSQRSMIGKQDIAERSKGTSHSVKKMSQAVGAMQELFGGTIPELFDKMDAIFGGNAAAMGGDQLMNRVMKMKQTSQLTGQSLNSLAQMNAMGAKYAMGAGMDAGIGVSAAEQTAIALGVNYAGGLTSTRRINQGRLRSGSLRANAAAATSRMARHHSGAFVTWLEQQGFDYNDIKNNDPETLQAYREQFSAMAGGETSLSGLAEKTGIAAHVIRTASYGDSAIENSMDDPTIAKNAIRRGSIQKQGSIARAIRNHAQDKLGRKIDMSMFMKDGQLLKSSDIIKSLKEAGLSQYEAEGIVTNQMDQGAQALFGLGNKQELEAYLYQQNNAGALAELRDKRAEVDKKLGSGIGGVLGIMNFLGSDKAGTATVGDALGAALGLITPEEQRKKLGISDPAERGSKLAGSLRAKYKKAIADGDHRTAGKIATVMNQLTNSDALSKLSAEDQAELATRFNDGDVSDTDLGVGFDKLATAKQILADKTLEETGFGAEYADAMARGDLKGAKAAAREAAYRGAIEGDNSLSAKMRQKINHLVFKGEGRDDDPTSTKDFMKRLENLKFEGGDEQRDALRKRVMENADALKVGDPKQSLQSVLEKILEFLESLLNDRKDISTAATREIP